MRSLALALLAVSTLAACSSRPAHAPSRLTATSSVDFGDVPVGSSAQRMVNVTLLGSGSDPLSVDSAPPDVTVKAGSGKLTADRATGITVIFAPTSPGPLAGTLVLRAGATTAEVALAGAAVVPAVLTDPPATLDFGMAYVGTSKTQQVRIENPSPFPETVFVTVDGDPIFRPDFDHLDIAPGASVDLGITFTPVRREAYQGTLLVRPCESCITGASVSLTARGIMGSMTVTPSPLDFGMQKPGSTACQDVSIQNTGDYRLAFGSIQADSSFTASGVFDLQLGKLLDGTATIEPGAKASIRVCFTPRVPGGAYSGRINFTSVDNVFTSLVVQGRGGDFVIQCQPDPIDFGITTPDVSNLVTIVCKNMGEPMDALLQTVTASDPRDLSFDFSQDGDPRGFNVGRADYHFGVAFRPPTIGEYSNQVQVGYAQPGNASDAYLVIPISAEVVSGAACDLDIPDKVRFGLVAPNSTHQRDVTIVNRDPVIDCVLWGFGLAPPGSDASDRFSLLDAPVGLTTILGGGSLTMSVNYDTKDTSSSTDRQVLSFRQMNAADTLVQIPIEGAVASWIHLSVDPYPIDFGTVAVGVSINMGAPVTNQSDEPITVMSVDVPAPFSISSSFQATTLKPGETVFVGLGLNTQAAGSFRGELEVWTKDVAEPVLFPVVAVVQ